MNTLLNYSKPAGALQHTELYSCFGITDPRIVSGFTATLTNRKVLLMMCELEAQHQKHLTVICVLAMN